MPVDVQTESEIDRHRSEVAAYASDPNNATAWYENIKTVEWKSEPPLAVGSRIAFLASFLGRRLAYTYEIKTLVPGERLVMSTADGPFPMETTYTWEESQNAATKMTLRNRGLPSGFSKVAAPVMAIAMRPQIEMTSNASSAFSNHALRAGSVGLDRAVRSANSHETRLTPTSVVVARSRTTSARS